MTLLKIISQGKFVAGVNWIAGQKIRDYPYICPHCGREADSYGLYAVTCVRSGAICSGLRDTVAKLLMIAEITAATRAETTRPSGTLVVADTYGALRADARDFVERFYQALQQPVHTVGRTSHLVNHLHGRDQPSCAIALPNDVYR